MTDFAAYQDIEFRFAQLFEDLSKTWATRDIAYVQELVRHAEYGEALENLGAIGARNGKGFAPQERASIEKLGLTMKLDPFATVQEWHGDLNRQAYSHL